MAMVKQIRKRDSERPQLRLCAWSVALLIAALGWLIADGRGGLVLDVAAAFVFAIGTVWPQTFRWFYRGLWSLLFLVRGRRQSV